MADVTREEAVKMVEALADAVARFAKSQQGQSQTDYKAQADAYNARDALIEALTRPAPSQSANTLVCVNCLHVGSKPEAPALSCCPERETVTIRDLVARMRGAAVPEGCVVVPSETLRRIRRTAEMSAGIMRDAKRTGGWDGAERVARQFERIAELAAAPEVPR